MRIIFWGTPDYSVPSLNILNKSDYEVVAVISQPDKKRLRGNKLVASPVKKYAINENIPIFTPAVIKGNIEFTNALKALSCDIFIVVAYGKILPKEILEIPKYGSWNGHASLLPRWRGAAPIQCSLLEGDDFTGVGIMRMEEGLDTGDILLEEKIKIDNEDNFISLSEKLSILTSKLFLKSLSKIEKNISCRDNNYLTKQISLGREIKYARMINKQDYKIDWENDAISIIRKIKALYPNANTIYKGKNLKIIKIRVLKDYKYNKKDSHVAEILKPGLILALFKNEGIVISTKTYPILLLEAKLEGKNISKNSQLIQQLNPNVGVDFFD